MFNSRFTHPTILVAIGIVILSTGICAEAQQGVPDRFDPMKVDPYMGDYEGEYLAVGQPPQPAEGKVIPEGSGSYRVMVSRKSGDDTYWAPRIELGASLADEGIRIEGSSSGLPWEGKIANGELNVQIQGNYGGSFALKHVVRESPTAGLKPPEGAIVLLPFEEGTPPDMSEWDNPSWNAYPDGSMEVGRGDIRSKKQFGDVRLHLEFCIPYVPEGRGQDRGNSGVYFQDRYEPQILDSYGLIPRGGDCGALYLVAVPPVNACLPPLSWQTYDVVFRAPRFDDDGNPSEFAWMTVELNGVKIHERQEISHSTVGGAEGFAPKGPFRLQDHGHKVRFRNIWVEELEGLE